MKNQFKFFLLIMLLLLTGANEAWSVGGERRVNLRGNWKFTLGDNPKYAHPGYFDSDWESVYVPSSWQNEGFRRYYGFAWYRIAFEIEFTQGDILALELGRVDDCDQVYVNGHLIGTTGGFPPNYFTAYSIDRTYFIPTEYLIKGKKNVIAVRVYDEGGEGGILGKNVGIYSYSTAFENGYSLAGNWKFHLFDDERWAAENVDDRDWENIVVPAMWETQGFRNYDGFAWYRKEFTLPANFTANDMVLLLGKIDDMDEVFLNGTRIGGTGQIDRKWARDDDWQKPRTYFIPDGLLHAGKSNVIAVRVFDEQGNGGIFEGPITLIPRSEYKNFWRQYRDEHYSYNWWSFFDWD